MKKWEYTYAFVDPSDDPVKEINQLGAEGWEVFAYEPENKLNHGVFFLKRERVDKLFGPYGTQDTAEMKRVLNEASRTDFADTQQRIAEDKAF